MWAMNLLARLTGIYINALRESKFLTRRYKHPGCSERTRCTLGPQVAVLVALALGLASLLAEVSSDAQIYDSCIITILSFVTVLPRVFKEEFQILLFLLFRCSYCLVAAIFFFKFVALFFFFTLENLILETWRYPNDI